ncbi:hypothetical protein Dimus_030523, partial [Dionaea muscipula]
MRELAEDGYSDVEVWVTPLRTEIIIRATRTQNVFGPSSLFSSQRGEGKENKRVDLSGAEEVQVPGGRLRG